MEITDMDVSVAHFTPTRSDLGGKRLQSAGIAELLMRAVRQHPNSGLRLIYGERYGESGLLTYPALFEEACRILGGLRAYEAPGARVALLLERPSDFIPTFWACILGGYIPCPMVPVRNDAARWDAHVAHVDRLLDFPLFVTAGDLGVGLHGVRAVELDALRDGMPADLIFHAELTDPALLVLTSGSTGNAKAVVLTHGNLLAAMAGKTERQRLTSADVTLNWISFDHVAALLEAHMLPLYVGAEQLHVDPALILADPLQFLRLIDRFRVSMTFAPNFLLGQINAAVEAKHSAVTRGAALTVDLSCLRHIVCGGEAIVVETGRRFLELLAPYGLSHDSIWPAFGMTETCAGSVYSREFPERGVKRGFAPLGQPIYGLQMRIVDEEGKLSPVGELQLRGPMVFSEYYNNAAATAAAFTADHWFRTGDLGRIDDGRLSLVGRSKDSIIVSGVNYFSHELETALQKLEGIDPAFVAAFPTRPEGTNTEQLVIACATLFPLDDEASLHQLSVAIRNATILLWGFRPAAILPLPREAFTKTSLGKIQRSGLRARFESGEFAEAQAYVAGVINRQTGGYTAPEGASELSIAQIYAEIFAMDPATLSATASFFDLGGTSLDIIKLKQALQNRVGIADLPIVQILQNPSVRALAASLGSQQSEYDPIVPLQRTGEKTPFFCVHPGIGEVLVFVNLARYFVNDRPFFAIRARGFNAGENPFITFEEMVTTYISAIRKHQAHGPYAIAGYSYGGPVAFEIAKRLEAQGEQVAFVGSIDMPPRLQYLVDAIDSAVHLAFFLSMIDRKQADELPGQLRSALPHQDPCAHIFSLAPADRLRELDLDLAQFTAWAALAQSLLDVGREYVPSGTVESVTVFYAQPMRGTKQSWLNDELKSWDHFARKANRYIDVPGEHAEIMGVKHVAGFQSVLRAEIDQAMGGR